MKTLNPKNEDALEGIEVGTARCAVPARVQRAESRMPPRNDGEYSFRAWTARGRRSAPSLPLPVFALKLVLLVTALAMATAGSAASLTLKVVDKEPPKELDASITAKLQKSAVQLLDGDKPAYEFWFVAELPLTAKPASPSKALDTVKQATLIGAVSIPKALRDYRDDELAAGVYTMRLALQPQDGNHLGTSEFNWFAVLVPAKIDTKPDGITDYKPLVKASSKETATDHPVILSLRPPSSADGDAPKLCEPAAEHKSVRVKVPAKFGEEKASLLFEVVYEGKGHK